MRCLKIEVEKETKEKWPEIGKHPRTEEAKQLREEEETEFREFCVNNNEERKTKKAEREKKSVNLCIEKDEKKRDNIDGMKRVILDSLGSKEPTQNVNKFTQREKITPANNERDRILGTKTDEKCEAVKPNESAELIKHGKRINKTINKIQQSYSIELAKQIAVENEAIKKNSIIPPRSSEKINVQFTKREFRHPARESKKDEEEEWLRQKAKAQQRKQKVKDDIQMDHSEV